MKILILDDDGRRHRKFATKYGSEDLTHVYTSHDAIRVLEKHDFDYVFLDHDLKGRIMEPSGPGTGYEVAEWISNNTERQPSKLVIVHSLNHIGSDKMVNVLNRAGIKSMQVPHLWEQQVEHKIN